MILYRWAQFKEYEFEAADLSSYEDAGTVDDWALEAMAWACGEGRDHRHVRDDACAAAVPDARTARAHADAFDREINFRRVPLEEIRLRARGMSLGSRGIFRKCEVKCLCGLFFCRKARV